MVQTDTGMVQIDTRVPKSPIEWDQLVQRVTDRDTVSALLNRHTSAVAVFWLEPNAWDFGLFCWFLLSLFQSCVNDPGCGGASERRAQAAAAYRSRSCKHGGQGPTPVYALMYQPARRA